MGSYLSSYDLFFYRYINSGLTHPALDPFFALISSNFFWGVILAGTALFALVRRDRYLVKVLLLLVFAVALNDVICTYALKPLFARVRPCHWVEGARRVGGICGSEMGMPSNHASNGMALAVILGSFFSLRLFGLALSCVLAVGFSRVYLSVHYPGDVLAGYAFGMLFGWAMARAARPLIQRPWSDRLGDDR